MSEVWSAPGSVDLSKAEVGLIPIEALPFMWPNIEPILYDKGKRWLEVVGENDVQRMLWNGEADLWCGMQDGILDGFMICTWERHARASYYHIAFLGGQHLDKYIAEGLSKVEKYASIMGAKEVVMEGRKGFVRWLRRYGYYTTTVRLRKNVQVLWR